MFFLAAEKQFSFRKIVPQYESRSIASEDQPASDRTRIIKHRLGLQLKIEVNLLLSIE
jgi:hypothetical protein